MAALDCGHEPQPRELSAGLSLPGYATDDQGRTFCYSCAAKQDEERLRTGDVWTGYLFRDDSRQWVARNFEGSFSVPVAQISEKKRGGGFGAQRTDVRFYFEGREWHGVNRGDDDILRCRLIKGRKPYARKTEDEFEIQGRYAQGWECVFTATSWKEARGILRDYRTNEPATSFRLVSKRVPIKADQNANQENLARETCLRGCLNLGGGLADKNGNCRFCSAPVQRNAQKENA